MGTSTNAILAYGYDLGGSDGYLVDEASEYGGLPDAWYANEADHEFQEEAERRLLVSVGFTETNWQAPGHFARKREAEQRCGVEIVAHCSGDYPMYILAAHRLTVRRGDVEQLDLEELQTDPVTQGWDDKLRAALVALGLTPKQQEPAWLLCSYWN